MSIIGQQKEIFEELRRLNPEVIEDGISDEDKYISSAYRIMYVLKEVNGGFGWSLCQHLKNGVRDQEHDPTWDNIARWTEGIFNLPEEFKWSRLENNCRQRRKDMLSRICAVNVKKTSGGYISNSREIYMSAQDNSDILKRQYKLYAPDIVVCCGTYEAFTDACFKDEEIKWQTTARGVWYFKDGTTTVISFSHPAARVRDCYLYYALTDAIMEILK